MSKVFKDKIYPILFMLIVTIICIAAVSGLFLSTRDLVLANEFIIRNKAVLRAADIELPETNPEITELFEKRVTVVNTGEDSYPYFVIHETDRSIKSYVLFSSGPGLWGRIEAVIGFDKSLSNITGIDFTKQNETPGLGARIAEDWFKEQFVGKQLPVKMKPEGTAEAVNEVDAVTGATRTSNFVQEIVNNVDLNIIKADGEIK